MSAGRPLAGVRVVEAGIALAGPFCGSLLADMGASVIKVERPDGGDPARLLGPRVENVALWWGVASRDKLCVAMDLKSPEGRERFLRLIDDADVLVENYRPGVMDRLGLDRDTLALRNPGLVMMSISGFGSTGPDAKRPGFGKIAEGLSGIVPLTGHPADVPLHVGFSLADTSAGLMGCMTINMALLDRDRNGGVGAFIDIGLYEPLLRMTELQTALHEQTGVPPKRTGSNDPYCWGAEPAWAASNHNGRRFVAATCDGGEELLVLIDPTSAPGIARLVGAAADADDDAAALDAALQAWTLSLQRDVAGEQLRAAGVEVAPVQDGASLAASAYFRARGDVVTATDPVLGELAVPGRVPLQPGGAAPGGASPNAFHAATVGEHDGRVFGDHPPNSTSR